MKKIQPAIAVEKQVTYQRHGKNHHFVHEITHLNIAHSMVEIFHRSDILNQLISEKKVGMVGAVYNVSTGLVAFSNCSDKIASFEDYPTEPLIKATQDLYATKAPKNS